MRRLALVAAFVLVTATVTNGQISGGTITGTIHDEQGGVLPDAVVSLTGTDRVADGATDDVGRFRFLNLAPGSYTVTATRNGFSTSVQDDIEVRVGATADVVMTMKLAGVQESITVGATGQVPIVDPRATGTSTNLTLADLENIPSSRDPFSLLRAVPGVLLDRLNIAGNETGQQPTIVSKGTRLTDTVWTLDGVVITDMASPGASAIYFNYDNFEEIQATTAGQDIRQPTGGLGVNLVVRRGTNEVHALVRGYFTNDALEATNVPAELRAIGVTAETADHSEQVADFGVDVGGPLRKDRLWFFASYSYQDIRLLRTRLVDRTVIKNPFVKMNWQAGRNDLVSFLYFDGDKVKEGRIPSGTGGILFHAATAVQDQHNVYEGNPFRGLWKVEDSRTFGSRLFASAKYAYFNTGFQLDPVGGLDMTSGRSVRLSRSFGSVSRTWNLRPQHSGHVDATTFHVVGRASHDVKFGGGWRRTDTETGTLWPGNGLLALDNSPTDRRVRVFREGRGRNRMDALSLYAGDVAQFDRFTIDVGVRFDRQTGRALPSQTAANPTFPSLVPGIDFAGYDLPFAWNNMSPRAGFTYAIDETRRTLGRVSVSRFAGTMWTSSLVGWANPSSGVGFVDYRWSDINGDNLATADEVLTDQRIGAGGGFNLTNVTAVTSSMRLADEVKAPVTTNIVAGVDREVMPNLALQVHYTHTRTTNHVGQVATRFGFGPGDYTPGPNVTGMLPDGLSYDIPTRIPSQAAVVAGGSGFVMGNWQGYATSYNGLDISVVKRLSGRWMGRFGAALNDAREHHEPQSLYTMFGNPTRTDTEPLVDGGQYAPGVGDVFLNSKWQVSASGAYVLPQDVHLAVSVFGRQGYPLPPFRQVALGFDQLRVLVTPEVDTYRLDNIWNTDLRIARAFQVRGARLELIGDIFNLLNANTELARVRNADAANYRALAQNLSPRILRIGVRAGF